MDYFLAFIEIERISLILSIKFHLDKIPPYFIKKGTK